MEEALDILLQIQNTQGNIAKMDVLKANEHNDYLKQIFYYTYNPFLVFGIAKKKLNKKIIIDEYNEYIVTFKDLLDVLQFLQTHNTGKDVIVFSVQKWIEEQQEKYKSIIKDIICKDLTIGMNTKSVNKLWKDLIPTYEVQQGEKWFEYIDKLDKEKPQVIVTQKFDGQRCSCRVQNGEVTLYSRNGKLYEGLLDLEKDLSNLPDGMYDGELLLQMNYNGPESIFSRYIYHPIPSKELFKKTASVVNSDAEYKQGVSIWLYDYTPLDNFDNMQDYNIPTIERKEYLKTQIRDLHSKGLGQNIHEVFYLYNDIFDYEIISKMLDEILKLDCEGLMINLANAPYEFKRSRNMLKVKKMYPVDLEVIRVEEGTGINQGKVGSLVVNYKGYEVKVGSGLNKEQRERWWIHPEEILHKIITVQYFEETTNKNDDSLSLRFPVFKTVRYDKDEESYN